MIQKKMLLKSKYIIMLLLVIAIFAPIFVSAAKLEAGIPGQVEPGAPLPGLTDYMRYVYWFLLGTVGIAAFVSLVWYGVLWIYSGIVEQKSEALEGIKNTFLGLVFAFSAYIILYTINPDLVSLRAPTAPVPSVDTTTPTKTTPSTITATPPPSKESIQTLAKDVLASSYLIGDSEYINIANTSSWQYCDIEIKGTKSTTQLNPRYTIKEITESQDGSATACRTGCSNKNDRYTAYCASTIPITRDMIEAISQVSHTKYDADSSYKPSFQIIEITGGDRQNNTLVEKHYAGRAIDVIPTSEKTGNEYYKIGSAFRDTSPQPKILCVDKNEVGSHDFFKGECDPAKYSNIDHMHIEW